MGKEIRTWHALARACSAPGLGGYCSWRLLFADLEGRKKSSRELLLVTSAGIVHHVI